MPLFEDKLSAAALYVALGLLWLLFLAVAVVRARIAHKVTLGDGGVPAVQQATRAHGNAAEYLPAGLAATLALALLPASPLWSVHAVGAALIVGRVLHGWGLLTSLGRSFGRATGILLTWGVYLLAAGLLVWSAAGR